MYATVLLGALLAGAAAAPPTRIGTPMRDASADGGKFTVPVRPRTAANLAGPLALAAAHNKFGTHIPEDIRIAAEKARASIEEKRATGSVNAVPQQYDQEYVSPVSFGTPAQSLPLDFDTGSSDLWVFSSSTPSSQARGHTLYSPSKSSTAKSVSGSRWSISYGDGSSSSGTVYQDTVNIGGLSVTSQGVEVATRVSSTFTSDTSISGLLGLGFDNINSASPAQKTWLTNVLPQLSSPLFSVDLRHATTGKYNFGFIDTSVTSSAVTYATVSSSRGFWEWTSSGYQVGSGSFKSTSWDTIADTGTSLLLVPDSIVSAYYSGVSGARYDSSQGGYTFSCSANLPSFTFGVGSARITVPGSYINYAAISSGTCFGGIQSSSGLPFAIIGDVALKAALVVFNRGSGSPTIGWAQK